MRENMPRSRAEPSDGGGCRLHLLLLPATETQGFAYAAETQSAE